MNYCSFLVVICSCLLLASVQATSFGNRSVVLTAKDLHDGNAENLTTLIDGGKYRVYAVYASSVSDESIMKSVIIRGAEGTQFNVADLAKPKGGTTYILDESNTLIAPITISFSTKDPLSPLTIYFVDADLQPSPVVSAQLVNGAVDSAVAKMTSSGCTVLSAEMAFELRKFVIEHLEPYTCRVATACDEISVTGFDSPAHMMWIGQDDFVVISGPIATISSQGTANVRFDLRRDPAWSGTIAPHGSTAFLSNGWLSESESYNVDYHNDFVLTRDYDFGRSTFTQLDTTLGWASAAKSIEFTCRDPSGDLVVKGRDSTSLWFDDMTYCSSVFFNVTVDPGSAASTPSSINALGPRFKFVVTSGARTLSAFIVILTTLFAKLM